MPEHEVLAIALAVLDALAAAHAAGIVHRDLKPANVFLSRGADGIERVKLLDFGISKIAGAQRAHALTRSGEVLGTPLYMAPEQLKSATDADPRADLWSWGALVFEMLSGKTPYEARTLEELVAKRLSEPPRSLDDAAPRTSAPLRRLVADTLALDPRDRPPSAEVIARGLRAFPATLASKPLVPRPAPLTRAGATGAPSVGHRSRLGWLPALLAFAIPVVLAGLCLVSIALVLAIDRFL